MVPPITGSTLPRVHTVTSLTIGGLSLTLPMGASACLISEGPDLATWWTKRVQDFWAPNLTTISSSLWMLIRLASSAMHRRRHIDPPLLVGQERSMAPDSHLNRCNKSLLMIYHQNWRPRSSRITSCQCSKVMRKSTLRRNMITCPLDLNRSASPPSKLPAKLQRTPNLHMDRVRQSQKPCMESLN